MATTSKKLESDLFKGFEKKQAPIQKVVPIALANFDAEKSVQFLLSVPESFKEKLEFYKLKNKKKSLKSVIIELVGPAIGYELTEDAIGK
jgi:hypothetical protein